VTPKSASPYVLSASVPNEIASLAFAIANACDTSGAAA